MAALFGQWDKEDKAKVCIVRRDGDSIKLRAETPEEVNDLLYQISLARVSLRIWRLEVNHLTAIICQCLASSTRLSTVDSKSYSGCQSEHRDRHSGSA